MEYRAFRAADGVTEDEGRLHGTVAVYNRKTQIGPAKYPGFKEEIAPGTFTKSVSERDIVMLDNHDSHRPLARKSAGTLTFADGSEQFDCDAQTPDTSYARDLRTNVKAGNYGGMSFGFEVVKDEWFDDEGNRATSLTGTHRVLREVKLIEVSPVTFPAYEGTSIQARDSVLAERAAYAERELRDADGDDDGDKKPYGDVKYADPKNGKYPIDTLKHVKAAWAYINVAKNAAKYPLNGVTLASVKAAIKAALKKFGVKISEQNEEALALEWREESAGYCIRCGFEDHEDVPAEESREQEPEASTPDEDAEALADMDHILVLHAKRAAELRAEALHL